MAERFIIIKTTIRELEKWSRKGKLNQGIPTVSAKRSILDTPSAKNCGVTKPWYADTRDGLVDLSKLQEENPYVLYMFGRLKDEPAIRSSNEKAA